MSYIVIVAFIVATLLKVSGYSDASPLWAHFIYMFPHSGLIHLLINSIAYFSLFKFLQQIYNKWFLLIIPYATAIIMSFFASYSLPTIGASGMVYAMLGFYIATVINGRITFVERWHFWIFVVGLILGFTVSFFKESSNTLLHILCFISGVIIILGYGNKR